MNIKKTVTLTLALLLLLIPAVAMADAQIDPTIIEASNRIETEKIELGNFVNPLTIYLSTIKDGRVRVDDRLTEGIRVSKDRTAIGVRDFVNLIDGLEIFWNEEHRMVVIKSLEGKEIVLPIDKNVIFTDGMMTTIDVPATIDPSIGRTFLPMRTLSDALGYVVGYDESTHTATITEPGFTLTIKDAVGEEVPTMQSLLDPVNEMFENENKKLQAQNIIDTITESQTPKLNTTTRTVNTVAGTMTKEYVDDIEIDLMRMINDYRAQSGVHVLEINSDIKPLSDIRVAEYSSNISNKHIRPDGSSWTTVGHVNGENAAMVSLRDNVSQVLFDAWRNSPGHNQNMLRREFNSFYVSVIFDGENVYAINLFKQ